MVRDDMEKGLPRGLLTFLGQRDLLEVRDDQVPVLKLGRDGLGGFVALGGRCRDGVDFGLEVISGGVRVLEEIDDVADASLFGRQAPGRGADSGHAVLRFEKRLPAEVAAVLEVCAEVSRPGIRIISLR